MPALALGGFQGHAVFVAWNTTEFFMKRMFVSHPNSYAEILTPSGRVLGSG